MVLGLVAPISALVFSQGAGFGAGGLDERRRVLAAANIATRTTKVAKVYISSSGKVQVSLENYVGKPEAFEKIFTRGMSALNTAKNRFVREMRK